MTAKALPQPAPGPAVSRFLRRAASITLALSWTACAAPGVQTTHLPPAGATESREADYREAARLRGQALAAMDAGDWTVAIAALEELERLLPDNVLPPLDLAVCHQQSGDRQAALAAAERARAIAPDNPRLLYALASIHHDGEDRDAWEATLAAFASAHPFDPRPHYLRARWLELAGEPATAYAAARQAVDREPENLVLLVERLVAAGGAELAVETEEALDAVEDRLGGFESPLTDITDELRDEIDAGRTGQLPPLTQIVRNVLRPDGLYRQHLIPLVGSGSAGNGIFVQLDFDPALPKSVQGGQDIEIAFVDRAPIAADVTVDGPLRLAAGETRDAVWAGTTSGPSRLEWAEDGWSSAPVPEAAAGTREWSRLDVDQDGLPDRLIETAERLVLASSEAGSELPVVELEAPLEGLFPVDFDHDGDLDLVASSAGSTRYLRNRGGGAWGEDAEALGELGRLAVSSLVSADFDDDGDLDLAAAAAGRLYLLINERAGQLTDATAAWGLDSAPTATRIAVEDFDADGRFDLLAWGGGGAVLLRNAEGRFASAELPETGDWSAAEVADFDNDGDRDVLAAGADGGLTLLRNRRDGFSAEEALAGTAGVRQLLAGDFDGDGDLDVAGRAEGRLAYWRNDGGSLNHWLRIRLRGKNENNSKNNSQGLFVRLESRAGDSYQAVLGDGGVNHLGLGAYRQADVLRVIWTNGLSQTWAALAAGQTLDEEQVLKGSCPFLYTWNGERFEFVTDLMWKSPLGMVLPNGAAAPHQSARDFVLVPGELLRPAGGELWLQVTEELWETIYVDRQQLIAVDHPESVELVVDEKFTPPPHPDAPQIHWVGRKFQPVGARGYGGIDVLDRIVNRDDRYVDGFPLARYQGTTERHDLELDFEDLPDGVSKLVLWGWIFPTDTSINVALSQSVVPGFGPPRLQLATADGWKTLVPSIGFPSGKRKALVVELEEPLPAGDVTLRLTTDMQLYWDAAALVLDAAAAEATVTVLEPTSADLHYRGFSRLRKESDSAPHLFDYERVSVTPPFRDLAGLYTRFGSVRDLITATDDVYVVMNAGDELTVRYPATGLPELPEGWRRDFILHTDGWVKDGDINTARSQTVEPLPHHAMRAYPDPGRPFPDGPEQRRWRETYQTRAVDDEPFRGQVRRSDG